MHPPISLFDRFPFELVSCCPRDNRGSSFRMPSEDYTVVGGVLQHAASVPTNCAIHSVNRTVTK